ncbi:hypothetical protein KR222_010359, partial [Zaprionus bogoriensis]
MFNFHKPRVYRSADGCCICRAKSSSSRFTASRKYEKESMQCFNLHEPRNGEICNACVLLVKRYKRLPEDSKRHWGHVVDARAGPGTKSLAKQKKRENEIEAKLSGGGGGSSNSSSSSSFIPEKFAKIFKKNRKGKITAATTPAAAANERQQRHHSKESSPHSEEQPSDSNESCDDDHQQQLQLQQQHPGAATAATPYQTRKRTAAAALLTASSAAVAAGGKQSAVRATGSKRRRMLAPMKHRRAVDNVPFFEEHDLLRLDVCCGTVFQSLSLGSSCYIIDPELYKPCEKHRRRRQQQQEQQQQQQLQQQQQQQQQRQQLQLELLKPTPTPAPTPTPTQALKKHHLFFKRQSESFPQGEIHRISPIPLNKTEAMPAAAAAAAAQQQHSSLSLALKPTAAAAATTTAAAVTSPANIITTTAVGAASPSSLSSSSNCSTSSSVATKFNDNSSDSGFDEHVLERKSVSPPTQQQAADRKRSGVQRLILASGLPITGQTQNLVLTGNEFTARFVQRQQQAAATQALKINVVGAGVGVGVGVGAAATTGSQRSGSNCNKMRAIFNSANTIQHENGVTTILPASSLAASNQTAAMNAIAPSTVTITPA